MIIEMRHEELNVKIVAVMGGKFCSCENSGIHRILIFALCEGGAAL